VSRPASADASSGVQTRRSASVQCDLLGPNVDLNVEEPEVLMCPITRTMFRDPVFGVESGHTYERSAILAHFRRNGAKDPLTRRALSSTKVMTNWAMRNVVQDWLDKHPGVTPDGWDSRELPDPSNDDGTRRIDDEGDVGVLRTWRAMCPELQERWPEAARPKDWKGVTMENGRVVKLELETSEASEESEEYEGFGLSGAVPAEIGQLTSLEVLNLCGNSLTSVPAVIGQLTSLTELHLGYNELTSVPAAFGQLTSLEVLDLDSTELTSVPAEIWQLTSLRVLRLGHNQLTSVPAEIGQLTSLEKLHLGYNQLTSVPVAIGQLRSLWEFILGCNKLTSVPAAIRELRAAGCNVKLDDGAA